MIRNLCRIVYLELLFSFRIPASLIFVFLAPSIMLLVLFTRYEEPGFIVAGLLSLVTGFSTMQGVGQVAAKMRFGIWQTIRLAAHPEWLYLAGVLLSRVVRTLIITAGLLLLAFLAYGYWIDGSFLLQMLIIFFGSLVFACLGLFLAYLPKSPMAAGNLINIAVLVMLIVSGIFFPVTGAIEWVSYASPMTFLTNLLRANTVEQPLPLNATLLNVSVLSLWALVTGVLAYRFAQRREDDVAF